MSFATPLFLWYFLPVVLAAVLAVPGRWRNGVIAVASLVFYAVGAGATTLLLLSCIVVNYVAGLRLEPPRDEWHQPRPGRKRLLVSVVGFDLGALFVWKYAGFATEQLNGLAHLFGGDFPVVHVALPIG